MSGETVWSVYHYSRKNNLKMLVGSVYASKDGP